MFTRVNQKPFEWEDLHRKQLTIHVGVDHVNGLDYTSIIGYDLVKGYSYLLHQYKKDTTKEK